MNPELNYLLATHRSAELRQAADRARRARDDRVTEAAGPRGGLVARTIVRVRLRRAARARLRARRV